ncbi:abhydrolase domain containing 10, depalmitoylase a isoform X3 [Anguilla anguilla]|uniref:abhydrolase domain containing 10, depalmitoylase a isoform X3 n=1 Tax=Anguilla anguilla TaxID=7936 RepID=UPI0015A908BA|nr:abhydrolase domain containing 10, depalmitoylase a isoform X3 [Anguilla anguilla]
MAAAVLRSWGRVVLKIGPRGAACLTPRASGGLRQKSTVQFATRPDQPKLAYRKVKGKSPGVVFLPGFSSNMSGHKAEALEEFCRSLGHSYLRFDYTGCGASEGVLAECTVGSWKRDVLYVLDELVDGPQILVGSGMGGWLMLLAAIARPEKISALVGISTAADHFVTAFKSLPLEVRQISSPLLYTVIMNIGNNEYHVCSLMHVHMVILVSLNERPTKIEMPSCFSCVGGHASVTVGCIPHLHDKCYFKSCQLILLNLQ